MAVDHELVISIVRKLGHLWEDDELSDIKIIIDDFQFNCQRFHLSACSEFFRVLLKSQTMDPSKDVITVHIRGLAPETFNAILLSVYKGELTVTTDNMLDLWHASHHLQIDFLVNKLEHFISRSITDDNFFIIYKMAVELVSYRIINSALRFMAIHYERIRTTKEFVYLPCDCLMKLIGHDELVVKSSDNVVKSILRWVDYTPRSSDMAAMSAAQNQSKVQWSNSSKPATGDDKLKFFSAGGKKTKEGVDVIFKSCDEVTYKVESSSQRKDRLGELIKLIKLENVSQDCLLTLLNNDDIIECREARTIVRQAFADSKDKKHFVREIPGTRVSSRILDRSPEHQHGDTQEVVEVTVPVIVYLQTSFNAILAYNLANRKTYSLHHKGLPTDGSIQNVYSHNNKLYLLISHSLKGKAVSSIYRFQQLDQWEYISGAPHGSHSFMFHENYIYCIVQFQVCRLNSKSLDNLVWVCVYEIPNSASSFVVSGNKIVILHTHVTEYYDTALEKDGAWAEPAHHQHDDFGAPRFNQQNDYRGYPSFDPNYYYGGAPRFNQQDDYGGYPSFNQQDYSKRAPMFNPLDDFFHENAKLSPGISKKQRKKLSRNSKGNLSKQTTADITYLDVSTWKSEELKAWHADTEIAFFEIQTFTGQANTASKVLNDDTYLLTKDGLVLHVTHPSRTSLSVTQEENVCNAGQFSRQIVGAARQEKVLYVFVNQGPGVCEPTPLKLTSFTEVKVIPLLKSDSNYVPVTVHQKWLIDEL